MTKLLISDPHEGVREFLGLHRISVPNTDFYFVGDSRVTHEASSQLQERPKRSRIVILPETNAPLGLGARIRY